MSKRLTKGMYIPVSEAPSAPEHDLFCLFLEKYIIASIIHSLIESNLHEGAFEDLENPI